MQVPQYTTVELDQLMPEIKPVLRSRFRWRAQYEARRLNKTRFTRSYRWEAYWLDGKWAVVAMQNQLQRVREGESDAQN
jgi:hypothetical protein